MANCCSGYLVITGPEEDLKKLESIIGEPDQESMNANFNLRMFLGKTRDECEDGNGGWCFNTSVNVEDDNAIVLNFWTKWSPHLEILNEISNAYPKCSFRYEYEEPGCDFEGYRVVVGGQTEEEYEGDYTDESRNEELREVQAIPRSELPKHVNDDWEYEETKEYFQERLATPEGAPEPEPAIQERPF